MITNGDLFNKFKTDYPDLEVEDYRPFCLDFVRDRLGITVWLKNGDIFLYFPNIKLNEACEMERKRRKNEY